MEYKVEKMLKKNSPLNSDQEINTECCHSIVDVFNQAVDVYADKVAYINQKKLMSYCDVKQLSENFAAYLQNDLSIKKGQRIGLMCPNNLPFVVAMWGGIRAGGVLVNINPLYTSFELAHQLNDAQVTTIIIISTSTSILAEIAENTQINNIIVIHPNDLLNEEIVDNGTDNRLKKVVPFTQALKKGESLSFDAPKLTEDDLLFLQYTGGTTGLSKGAMLSHGNLMANILQYEEHAKEYISKGEETVITAIPMYHIFALMANCIAYFSSISRHWLR